MAEATVWNKFADVRATYPSADKVKRCTVFNVGGNNYRVITRISYEDIAVFILHVLTHAEYDRDKWKGGC